MFCTTLQTVLHTYLVCVYIFGLCVSVEVKLSLSKGLNFLFYYYVYVHSAWKCHPQIDLNCVGWDVKLYSLIHSLIREFAILYDLSRSA